MRKYRKEITFDLDTNELKKEFGVKNYGKGYRELKRLLSRDYDYEHRQGSVYCSFKTKSLFELCQIMVVLRKRCPWLKRCLRRMDIANIGLLHEITNIIKF